MGKKEEAQTLNRYGSTLGGAVVVTPMRDLQLHMLENCGLYLAGHKEGSYA